MEKDKGCLLCKIPENLITYLVLSWKMIQCRMLACFDCLFMNLDRSTAIVLRKCQQWYLIISGTCKKHQRKITRCIKHARSAGLIPFQLTPEDYELYDMVTRSKMNEEEEEEEEESLAEKLNQAEAESTTEGASEDFVKLMNLLSAEEKDEQEQRFILGCNICSETFYFFSICSRIHFTRLMQSDLVFPGIASAIRFHLSFLSIEAGN